MVMIDRSGKRIKEDKYRHVKIMEKIEKFTHTLVEWIYVQVEYT
jgi:hypothetical protein